MKFMIVMLLAFSFETAFAKSKSEKEAQKTEGRNAKAVCLMKNNLLRGQLLIDCMKEEIEKNRKSDQSAKNKATNTP